MGAIPGKYVLHFCFLDEFIQGLFFLLPFLDLKHLVNPSPVVGTQHILGFLCLIVIVCALCDGLLAFHLLLVEASFDDHWLSCVAFREFDDLFFDLGMHAEVEGIFSHPSESLFEKLNRLGLGNGPD